MALRGHQVVVKPNYNSADPHPAATNPFVVSAVVRLLYEAGAAHVVLAESSGPPWVNTRAVLERSGVWEAAERVGAEVVDLTAEEWVTVAPPAAKRFRQAATRRPK